MKLLINIILFSSLFLPLSCFYNDEDCYYPMDITEGTLVAGAGSNQYNGNYYNTGFRVNGYDLAEKTGTTFTIEYDLTYNWCIKDNGIIQYYAPGCFEYHPYECIANPFIPLNGNPPAPTTERLYYIFPAKCGF